MSKADKQVEPAGAKYDAKIVAALMKMVADKIRPSNRLIREKVDNIVIPPELVWDEMHEHLYQLVMMAAGALGNIHDEATRLENRFLLKAEEDKNADPPNDGPK